MPDITESLIAIRDIAIADATLTALLSSSSAVYYGRDVALSPAQPYIVMWQLDDAPMQGDSAWGDFRVRLQVNVIGTDPQVLNQIVAQLDELFVIPFKRATHITTDNFKVRQMMRASALLLPVAERVADGMRFQQLVTEWILKVTATT